MKNASRYESSALSNSSEILSLIASAFASSRGALLAASGLSRVTVTQRVNALLACGLVRETEETFPSGGRPTRMLTVAETAGVILVANIGETHINVGVVDIQPAVIEQKTIPLTSPTQPSVTLTQIQATFSQLLADNGIADRLIFGVSFSLPTPVDYKRGCVVGPSVLPGWDEFDIKGYMRKFYDAPVFVENDVNLMTIYEHRHNFRHVEDMFFIKAGTGIGSGIVTGGRIFRGAQGAAGDIGHIQFTSDNPPLCRCGKLGCVEARAGGWAIARDLTARGIDAENARDVVNLVDKNKPEAIMLVRRAGQTIGEAASDAVSLLNPSLIVVGGTLSMTGDFLLSGVRELVYQRCLPLATRELHIVLADPRDDSALLGAAHLVLDDVFSKGNVGSLIERFVKKTENVGAA